MKKVSLCIMIVFYIAAGVNHFIHPEFYRKIMPLWVPLHKDLVFITGICEIMLAVLLVFPSTRRIAAYCLMGFLIAVFPANIQMMLNYIHENNSWLWVSIVRLPLQIVLIWWAYSFTRSIVLK